MESIDPINRSLAEPLGMEVFSSYITCYMMHSLRHKNPHLPFSTVGLCPLRTIQTVNDVVMWCDNRNHILDGKLINDVVWQSQPYIVWPADQ